jgi:hypothetical protein
VGIGTELRAEWLTLTVAERLYSIPVATWRRWIRERRVGYSKPAGGRILVCRREIEDLLERCRRGPREDVGDSRQPRLSQPRIDPKSILAQMTEGRGGT